MGVNYNMIMKTTYDKTADAAYIYLVPTIKKGGVKKTVEVNENINLDYDENNRLIGVEVLSASQNLTKKTLTSAIRIDKTPIKL